MKIVELILDDNEDLTGIEAISIVENPAIEEDFIALKGEQQLQLAEVDKEKRILLGALLVPNKPIYRKSGEDEYYIYFSQATVRKASELYLKNNNHHKATCEHSDRVSGVLTVESWIIEDPKMDKSTLYGFSLPKGTWMVSMRISNEELWSKIKDGELKGLSIEGYFCDKMEKMSEKTPTDADILIALNEMLNPKLEKIAKELSKTQNLEDYPWEQCIADQTKAHSKEDAEKICGYIKSKYGN